MRSLFALVSHVAATCDTGSCTATCDTSSCTQPAAGSIIEFYQGIYERTFKPWLVLLGPQGQLDLRTVRMYAGAIEKLAGRLGKTLREEVHGFSLTELHPVWKRAELDVELGVDPGRWIDRALQELEAIVGKEKLSVILNDITALVLSVKNVRVALQSAGHVFPEVAAFSSPNDWFAKHSATYFKPKECGKPRDCETFLTSIEPGLHSLFGKIADSLEPSEAPELAFASHVLSDFRIEEESLCAGMLILDDDSEGSVLAVSEEAQEDATNVDAHERDWPEWLENERHDSSSKKFIIFMVVFFI